MFWEFFDWKIIAQAMFGLSIALFTLPGGIIFKCEYLANRAKGRLSNERASFRKEWGNTIAEEYNKLGQLFARTAEKGSDESEEKDIEECYKSIKRLRKMIIKYVKGLRAINRWRTRSSILKLGVVYSAICLGLSAILSGLAWGLAESDLYLPLWITGCPYIYLNHTLLILAAVSLILGVYFGARTLRVTLARSK
jgi:hypothetical protein